MIFFPKKSAPGQTRGGFRHEKTLSRPRMELQKACAREVSESPMLDSSSSPPCTLSAPSAHRKDSGKTTRTRVVLTNEQAREIFQFKGKHGFASSHSASIFLASKYQVSSKAIRDIWKGRSWLDATFNLWEEEERPLRRSVGRPKGKRDSKPRKTKSIKNFSGLADIDSNLEFNRAPSNESCRYETSQHARFLDCAAHGGSCGSHSFTAARAPLPTLPSIHAVLGQGPRGYFDRAGLLSPSSFYAREAAAPIPSCASAFVAAARAAAAAAACLPLY